MDKKYGVYICEGCGIGEALDVEAIRAVADEEGLTAKTNPILCSPEGVDFLKQEIEGGVTFATNPGKRDKTSSSAASRSAAATRTWWCAPCA